MLDDSFLNHLCDGELRTVAMVATPFFLNHLCDGEHFATSILTAVTFLNHLCDGERPVYGHEFIVCIVSKPSMRWRTMVV
ncbi:hypothetical protein ENHYDAX1_220301 [Enhydrobacter sp. AX1]|nr:hypothetical protein ENHYDAX1_220301 [Enhydrobacter sp. AX1]